MSIKIIIAFLISAVLWRLGGYHWKWVRRFVLPTFIILYVWMKKRKWLVPVLFPFLVIAFSLGYGERRPYWQKFLVGVAWILPAVFLGNYYALIVPFVWILLFKLSNTKPYSNIFRWWLVEIIIGGLIGVSYVYFPRLAG